MKRKNSFETLAASREELRHWPHTIHQIDDTLDLNLIEGRAKQILFQSLTDENTFAFLGSGFSAAYGRMGWSAWKNAQIEVTKNLAQYFLNLCSHAQARMILMEGLLEKCTHARPEAGRARRWLRTSRFKVEYANAEVKKLNVAFAKSYSDTGTFPGGEAMPIQFEIAQKLHDLILSQRELFLDPDRDTELNDDHIQEIATWGVRWRDTYGAPEKSIGEVAKREAAEIKLLGRSEELEKSLRDYVSLAVRPEGRANFEKIAKWLLVDECAHAEWYLKNGAGDVR